jgi:hypothetical protein
LVDFACRVVNTQYSKIEMPVSLGGPDPGLAAAAD